MVYVQYPLPYAYLPTRSLTYPVSIAVCLTQHANASFAPSLENIGPVVPHPVQIRALTPARSDIYAPTRRGSRRARLDRVRPLPRASYGVSEPFAGDAHHGSIRHEEKGGAASGEPVGAWDGDAQRSTAPGARERVGARLDCVQDRCDFHGEASIL